MIHFINFPQSSNTPFQKLYKLCETVHVLNYTIIPLEEILSIIQARNDLCSTMTDLQLADLEFLVLNTNQSKPSVMEIIIYKKFYWYNIRGPK